MIKKLSVGVIWNIIGLIFSVLGIISLFGEVGEIAFSEWLSNLIDAFHIIVNPIVDILLFPVSEFFDYNFSLLQKDIFVIGFFIVDNLLADLLATIAVTKNNFEPEPLSYSFIRRCFYKKSKKLRRFFIWYIFWKRKLITYFRNYFSLWIFKKISAVLIPMFLTVKTGPVLSIEHIKSHDIDVTITVFMIIYLIPMFSVGSFFLGIFFNFLGYFIYVVIYIFYYIYRYVNHKFIYKIYIAPKAFSMSKASRDSLSLAVKQVKFTVTFTALFFLIIGLNYKYLN